MKEIRQSVSKEVDKIIEHEKALQRCIPTEASENNANVSFPLTVVTECLSRHKQINMAVDSLVQLNSALAYIISQSFFGGPPLARNQALIGCYSLFGIGTAITAIQKLTEFIVKGFGKYPIATVISQHYRNVTLEAYLKIDPATQRAKTPDFYLTGISECPQTPKLAYFSTRMGFSEHNYCVTAATQTLSSADASRRNLLTLSHELLHAHVKGLFATILTTADQPNQPPPALIDLIQEYRVMAKESEQNQNSQHKWSVLKYLRFRVFVFCDTMFTVVAKYPGCQMPNKPQKQLDFGPDSNDEVEAERFKQGFGFLNEIVVHILDLHYFYDESERVYLRTLWKSWATVPGVADKIEWYVLRCLTAASVINMSRLRVKGILYTK
jgi:hypothetical protein